MAKPRTKGECVFGLSALWAILLIDGCTHTVNHTSPSPGPNPSRVIPEAAPLMALWRAINTEDPILLSQVFSERIQSLYATKGWDWALSQYLDIPVSVMEQLNIECDPACREVWTGWLKRLPTAELVYRYESGKVLVYVPESHSRAPPEPFPQPEGPALEGYSLFWVAPVVLEEGEWKLDEL
jgi:hypothetical protein